MATERQIKANRSNAKQSTGPKTNAGKARSSRNARRHGLSRWSADDRAAETLSAAISAMLTGPLEELAVSDLAYSRLQLSRVYEVRRELLAALMACPEHKQMKALAGLARYEKAAHNRQRRVLARLRLK